jgi:hypothetical protein
LAGHSWWALTSEVPYEGFLAMSSSMNFNIDLIDYLGITDGFCPFVELDPLNILLPVPGTFCGGSDRIDAHRHFEIGFGDLINGLKFTDHLSKSPGFYFLYSRNCTTKAVEAGADAGVSLPPNWNPQNLGIDLNNMPIQ